MKTIQEEIKEKQMMEDAFKSGQELREEFERKEKMNYKKMWNTLKAESGHRYCSHCFTADTLTIRELMEAMEKRGDR